VFRLGPNIIYLVETKTNMAADGRPRRITRLARNTGKATPLWPPTPANVRYCPLNPPAPMFSGAHQLLDRGVGPGWSTAARSRGRPLAGADDLAYQHR